MPSDKEIEEFRKLYEQQFGIELSDEEAADTARRLVQLVSLLNLELFRDDVEG